MIVFSSKIHIKISIFLYFCCCHIDHIYHASERLQLVNVGRLKCFGFRVRLYCMLVFLLLKVFELGPILPNLTKLEGLLHQTH